ncbi:hypothetical protein F183_A12690 [Bryobacterales bacterium F-183]|nr:hypothetical protein F183_A12690 [Bryobacterales bacterium F-183]
MAAVVPAAADTVAADFLNGGLIGFSCPAPFQGCNAGYAFTVNQTVRVTSLGVYDSQAGIHGIVNNHQVGIWNASNNLVASATAGLSSPIVTAAASGIGRWLFQPITPLNLAPGTYIISAFYPTGEEYFVSSSASTTVPEITIGLPWQKISASFERPTTVINTPRFGYFGPGFQIATAVPEPASAGLLIAGPVGALLVLRRRRRPTA